MTLDNLLKDTTPEERDKIKLLKAQVQDDIENDLALLEFCSDFTYLRYLRARNYNVEKATKMLKATIEWRKSFKPELLRWKDVSKEGETGKIFRLPVMDKNGRPVLILRSRKENTKAGPEQIRHLFYHVELACRLADAEGACGKMTLIIDYGGYSWRTAPSSKQGLKVLSILQNHYPERLGLAVMYHAPKIFSVFWTAISPFIDPITYHKIRFFNAHNKHERQHMEELFDVSQLEDCLGGDFKGEMFDFDTYTKRMQEEEQRWFGNEQITQQVKNTISNEALKRISQEEKPNGFVQNGGLQENGNTDAVVASGIVVKS
eukprot:TRINITY_DN10409_c1_g3_i1.p2 TRINITY_DN10409_c1_g3~~TRINITY_DN10409_c1_g3_i1.p2  ORF type:complete len:326 (+),score=33.73 TRINITY_DN10409_c1_g3_i1:27-980(+)